MLKRSPNPCYLMHSGGLAMGLTKYKLGELIRPCDERNYSGKYTLDDIKGISTEKTFIATKANMDGVGLASYKLVDVGEFAYVADTSRRGDKIAIAYNDGKKAILISSIYTVFQIARRDILLPDYLFMYFSRPGFDRYARFNSWGSARETFDWNAMCDININLPSVPVQQKYVDIYEAMLRNQQSYERGLEDLKLACEAVMDKMKREVPHISLGELFNVIDKRNINGKYISPQGINITKNFMPTVASVEDGSLANYKIVESGQFAYSSMQTGRDKCIRIAMHYGENPIIVSPAYSVLQAKKEKVVPEYLMLWLTREETDRRGWFASDASIRANLDLERFFEFTIPLPERSEQQAVANLFRAYMKRKEIVERIRLQLKNICPILIKGSLEEGKP